MMPRSQIAALAVLLVGLGVVLVLVGDTGVSTGVFLPDQPTETVTPTITPSPTPTPESSAANWAGSPDTPGQLTYAADPAVNAQIVYQTTSYDDMVGLLGVEPPPEDDPYPLVTLLNEIRTELESQVVDTQLTLEPEGVTGPVIEVVEGVAVDMLRVRVPPQTTGSGEDFTGLDLVQMFIEHPDGNVTFVQYVLRGEPNPTVYADFRAWLAANIGEITSESAEATPEATPEAETTGQPQAGPTQEATGDVTPEPTAEAGVAPDATEETTLEPTAEAGVTPDATEEAALAPGLTSPLAPEEKWIEDTPGQVAYARSPNAVIMYMAAPLDEFAASTGMQIAEGAPLPTAEDILSTIRTLFEADIEDSSITLEGGALEGPITEDVNGVPFTFLHMTILEQTTPDGQDIPGQEFVIGLTQTGENRLAVVRFVYQDVPDPTVYADFREWLTQNITRLTELDITQQ